MTNINEILTTYNARLTPFNWHYYDNLDKPFNQEMKNKVEMLVNNRCALNYNTILCIVHEYLYKNMTYCKTAKQLCDIYPNNSPENKVKIRPDMFYFVPNPCHDNNESVKISLLLSNNATDVIQIFGSEQFTQLHPNTKKYYVKSGGTRRIPYAQESYPIVFLYQKTNEYFVGAGAGAGAGAGLSFQFADDDNSDSKDMSIIFRCFDRGVTVYPIYLCKK